MQTKTNFIILTIIIVIAVSGLFIIQNKYNWNSNKVEQGGEVKKTEKLSWTKDSINFDGRNIISINDFPDEVQVSADSVFGSSEDFTGALVSPDGKWLAITITGGVHEFGWLYEFSTEKLIPVAFSFDGGVTIKKWQNNDEIIFEITSPKPETSDFTVNINKLPEYPRYKSTTGGQIREEMSKSGCPDTLIVNKMPGPAGEMNGAYYIKNGIRIEFDSYDPIWLKANCDVPIMEVF